MEKIEDMKIRYYIYVTKSLVQRDGEGNNNVTEQYKDSCYCEGEENLKTAVQQAMGKAGIGIDELRNFRSCDGGNNLIFTRTEQYNSANVAAVYFFTLRKLTDVPVEEVDELLK